MKTRTQSQVQMPTYEVSGSEVNIFWDEQAIHRQTETGEEVVYDYAYCVAPATANYDDLVGVIIRSQYSINQEFAAINAGGERHAAFLTFRDLAKSLARNWIDQR
jgi:hypothetical protein